MAVFFVLACAITWLLAFPLTNAWIHHVPPPAYAIPLAGLSALGPTLAAVAVALPRGELRGVFGRWRTNPVWIVVALFMPMALHSLANVLELLCGGRPSAWFHPPTAPEQIAALVVFSFGEEFGWRGFAHPRAVQRFGPVAGSLLLGLVWAIWHLMYSFSPVDGSFGGQGLLLAMLELPLYSVVIAWLFERTHRSMAVAVAIHMGGHLDNSSLIPESELRLRLFGIAIVAVLAFFAARSLRAQFATSESEGAH